MIDTASFLPVSIMTSTIKTLFEATLMVAISVACAVIPEAQPQAPDYSSLVEKVAPAVVQITTFVHPPVSKQTDPVLEFSKKFQMPSLGQPELVPYSTGSGFIISKGGAILTNNHVIDSADLAVVTLPDHRSFKATLVGRDVAADVAILKINTGYDLPVIHIGNSESLKVGESVIAIGEPFGFDKTVTSGIVSAKDRNKGDMLPWIQTDVPINPGNSGGPLINMKGEVVGINSQIYTKNGTFAGISFAIPIEEAMVVFDDFKRYGRVVRGMIGVSVNEPMFKIENDNEVTRDDGAVARFVVPGGPADKAGLIVGDLIVGINDKKVTSAIELPHIAASLVPGQNAILHVIRDGKPLDLTVTAIELK